MVYSLMPEEYANSVQRGAIPAVGTTSQRLHDEGGELSDEEQFDSGEEEVEGLPNHHDAASSFAC